MLKYFTFRDGKPSVGVYVRVWQLAVPIIVSNLSIPLVGAVDTAVVGHLPEPVHIGAVAIGAMLFSVLFWGFGFLRMGTTGFVSQALGRSDQAGLRVVFARACVLALVFALAVLLLQWPIAELALVLIDTSERMGELTRSYFQIRIWGAPATLLNYVVLGTLIGLQRTQLALVHQLVLNLTNVALDLVLVLGFGFGVAGVAAASVAAELLAAVLGLRLVHACLPGAFSFDRRALLAGAGLKSMLGTNVNIAVRTLCLIGAFFYFTRQGAGLGELTLAANAVLMHLHNFLAYGLDGFAHAAEALAGSAYGARRRLDFIAAVRASTWCALGVAVLYTLLYAFAGNTLVAALTDIETVRRHAADYLPWLVAAPLVSVWSFQLDGIFIGATRAREMRNAMLLSLGVFLPACWLLVPALGNHGLWLALTLFMGMRAVTLAALYPRLLRGLH